LREDERGTGWYLFLLLLLLIARLRMGGSGWLVGCMDNYGVEISRVQTPVVSDAGDDGLGSARVINRHLARICVSACTAEYADDW